MPKTLVAQNVASISSIRFVAEAGLVSGLVCQFEVNYGTQGLSDTLDIWLTLTAAQQNRIQEIYNAIVNKITHVVMD